MEDAEWQPVIRRKAEFWMRWSLAMFEGLQFGNQIGAAKLKVDSTSARKVIRRVSLSWPQEEPQRAFRMLSH